MNLLNNNTCLTILILSCFSSAVLAESDESDSVVEIYGFVAARTGIAESQDSWLEGGFGRFDIGDSSDDQFSFFEAEIQLALEWSIGESTLVYLHAQGRSEDANEAAKSFGLVEGFVEYSVYADETESLALQLGQIFLPTSQENTEGLWQSPYTLTLSTWNSWIGQELRPFSFNLNYQSETFEGNQISTSFGIFQGNDSLGSQLAWGGWRMSRRLSVTNEVLPLGPLFSLQDNAVFNEQRDDGSKAFGRDLDNRLGYHAHINWRNPEVFSLRASYVDNRGDRKLSRGEYAWDTSFVNLGAHWQIAEQWELLGEFIQGKTGMGAGAAVVDVDFSNAYIMSSWKGRSNRISLRFEDFELKERDFSLAENNDEDGTAWTLAWIYQNESPWRFAVEMVSLKSNNAAQLQSGFSASNQDKMITIEIRRSIN